MSGDYCSHAGALALARTIEAYWAERGYDARVKMIEAGFNSVTRSCRVDLRSNLRNGLPPRKG